MFWAFNLSFIILATVLATFPNIWPSFVQFSGHSGCHAAAWVMDLFCNCYLVKNRAAHIRHQCRKTTALSSHRFLNNTGVEKMNYI
jgi:hypothetical protein